MAEQFANDVETMLVAPGMTSVTSTAPVASVAGFPGAGTFRLRVENELMLVVIVSGSTFLVVRGIEGTTAAAHAAGVAVVHVLTAGALGGTSDATSGTPSLRSLGKTAITAAAGDDSRFPTDNQKFALASSTPATPPSAANPFVTVAGLSTIGPLAVVIKNGTYTPALGDADDTLLLLDAPTDEAFVIPPDSSVNYPSGTSLKFGKLGDGAVAIVPAPGVNLRFFNAAATGKYVEDQFVAAAGATINSHTADIGGQWTWAPGTGVSGKIETNRVHGDGGSKHFMLPAVPISPDYDVEGIVYCVSDAGASITGVVGRQDPTLVQFMQAGWDAANNDIRLQRLLSGGAIVNLGTPFANVPTPGEAVRIRLRMRGNQHSVYVDDMTTPAIGPVTDTNVTAAGRVGLALSSGTFNTGLHLESMVAAPDLDSIVEPTISSKNIAVEAIKIGAYDWLVVGDLT